jgi:hypothetical protein
MKNKMARKIKYKPSPIHCAEEGSRIVLQQGDRFRCDCGKLHDIFSPLVAKLKGTDIKHKCDCGVMRILAVGGILFTPTEGNAPVKYDY